MDGSTSIKDILIEERVERFGVLAAQANVIDVEVGEERLVEQPAYLRVSGQVGGVAVASQVQRRSEIGFDLVERRPAGAEPFLDASQLAADALLLGGDQVKRHGTAVDSLYQLLPLAGELGLLAGEVLVFALGILAAGGQLGAQAVLDGVAQTGVEPDGGPVIFDHLLDLGDQQGLAGAGSGLHVSAEAHEVGVHHAVAVLGVGDDQPAAAVTTEHAGFEVVQVVALPLANEVRCKHILNLLPGDRIDQWLVDALVDHAPVHDLAFVVRVGQNGMQHVRFHRA